MRTRREWEPEIKRRILSEMALAGANVSAISRRHGVAQSLLYRWRKDAVIASARTSAFVPVVIDTPKPSSAPETVCGGNDSAGTVPTLDVILGGNRILRVRETIDAAALKRIVAALEAP